MLSRFSLKQKLAFAGLLIAIAMIALSVYFSPTHGKGVEMSEPICPSVCPPPY